MAFRLLLISPATSDLSPLLRALEEVPDLGGVAVLLRRPGLATRELWAEAEQLGEVCRARGLPWLVHRRVDLAKALDAAGVHLPERGLTVAEARGVLGDHALVGASRHDVVGLRRAAAGGATYATLSPLFGTPGKGPALGLERFASTRGAVPGLPVLALGGIGPREVASAIRAGADGVAAIRGVSAAPRPAEALARMREAVEIALDGEAG